MLKHSDLKDLQDKAYNSGFEVRRRAADDQYFAWVSQWDDEYLSESDLAYRGEFNILRKAMRQTLTDLILNPVQVDFEPVDETDDSAAEILDGMYRSDTRNNRALEAVDNAKQESVVCGVGAWEWRNEYKTNRMGDERQCLKRYPIYEANNNVFWDPNAKLIDKSDATYVSVLTSYSEDGYKKLKADLGLDETVDSSFFEPESSWTFPWVSESKKINVVRFYHRELKNVKYLTFKDMFGSTLTMIEEDAKLREDELFEGGYDFESEKKIKKYVVTLYIASGEAILETSTVPGEHIPVVPQYGERAFVDGVEHYEGIVRLAKDPQRLRNFQLSYLADIVSRSPREKPIFTAEQIGGFEDMYEENGVNNNYPYMLQNALDAKGNPLPVGPIGYLKAPEVPPALMQSIQESRAAVDDVASPGLPQDITDTDLSGKAVQALQKRLDMQSYTYQHNHKFAIRRDGEIYASMAAVVHDTEQDVTLIKPDSTKMTKRINAPKMNYETMEPEVENDMTSMIFEVYADIGPSFESVKAQNKEEIKELINGQPPGTPIHSALMNQYIMLTDGVQFEDLREYARRELIMSGIKKPETDEEIQMVKQAQENQQPDSSMVMAQAELLKGQADMQEQQNRAMELQLQAGKVQADAQAKIDKLESETALNVAKLQQGQQKLDDDFMLKATELELSVQRDLSKQIQDNQRV